MEQGNASCRTATGGRVDKGLGPWSAGVQGFYRALSSCLFSLVKMQGPSLIWGDGVGVERELNFSPVNLQIVHPSLQWTPTVLASQECERWMHIRYLPQTLQLAPLQLPWCEREAMAAVKPFGFCELFGFGGSWFHSRGTCHADAAYYGLPVYVDCSSVFCIWHLNKVLPPHF